MKVSLPSYFLRTEKIIDETISDVSISATSTGTLLDEPLFRIKKRSIVTTEFTIIVLCSLLHCARVDGRTIITKFLADYNAYHRKFVLTPESRLRLFGRFISLFYNWLYQLLSSNSACRSKAGPPPTAGSRVVRGSFPFAESPLRNRELQHALLARRIDQLVRQVGSYKIASWKLARRCKQRGVSRQCPRLRTSLSSHVSTTTLASQSATRLQPITRVSSIIEKKYCMRTKGRKESFAESLYSSFHINFT